MSDSRFQKCVAPIAELCAFLTHEHVPFKFYEHSEAMPGGEICVLGYDIKYLGDDKAPSCWNVEMSNDEDFPPYDKNMSSEELSAFCTHVSREMKRHLLQTRMTSE
jgi:hypothetical protein